MSNEFRVVAPADFGAAAAEAFLELLRPFAGPVAGLATGNTPVGIYVALRGLVGARAATVANVRAFALDEYVGDRVHPCSNRSYFARYWDAIPAAQPVVQFDPTAPDLAANADHFARRLNDAGGLDLAVLGIGTNGHLAFNEPGSGIDAPTRVLDLTEASREGARPCWQDATPTRGMTIGMREIMAARRILLLANGSAKSEVVARALRDAPSADCPASWLQLHPAVVAVFDSEAYRR